MVNKNKYEDRLAWSFLAGILLLFAGFVLDGTSRALTLLAAVGVVSGAVAAFLLRDRISTVSANVAYQERKETVPSRRKLSLRSVTATICALSMILSIACPVSASEISTDTETESSIEETDPKSMEGINRDSIADLPAYIREQVAVYIDTYHIAHDMSDGDLANIYFMLDSEQSLAAWNTLNELLVLSEELSEEEANTLLAESNIILCLRFYSIVEQINNPVLLDLTENYPFEPSVGGISVVVSAGTGINANAKDDILTVTATGTSGCSAAAATATITITNTKSNNATVSFDYVATDVYSLNTGDASNNENTISKNLTSGESFTIVITTDKNATENRLVLSNFKSVDAKDESTVKFYYDDTLGSITVDGTAEVNEGTRKVTSGSVSVTASVTSSSDKFLGWINSATGQILNEDATCSITITDDIELRAVFASKNTAAWFEVNGNFLFTDLNTAASKGAKVVLAYDGKLPAGNYTIPSNVTLLIPFDDAETLYTNAPEMTTNGGTALINLEATYIKPTAYRTLTMDSNAHITVEGAMSISGKQSPKQGYSGNPSGPQGFINMKSGSTITIDGGGFLYAWGFITGSGSVTVNNTATVYECFQVTDWRGGTASRDMLGNDQKVFPMSQYYVQNVEVPMTLLAGAKEFGYISVIASKITYGTPVPFIGNGSMFVIGENGSITKDYIEDKDRLQIDINGNLSMSSLTIEAGMSINSADYVLPVTNNITVNVNSGTTVVSQDMALLPGCQINVTEGAFFNLAEGKSLYVYDADNWNGQKFVYSARDFSPIKYAPGKTHTRTATDIVDAKITVNGTADGSAGYVYTTTGGVTDGANLCSTGSGKVIIGAVKESQSTYQATQSGTTISYTSISLTPAKLKNSDGTFVATAGAGGNTYTYTNGFWRCKDHTYGDAIETKAPTCTEVGTKASTCSVCGYINTVEVPALGHTSTSMLPVLPTFDKAGTTGGTCCSNCEEVLTPPQEIPAAQVGDITYLILKEAIAAADRKNNVVLLTNVNGKVPVGKHVTIEKGSYTAQIEADTGFTLAENGTATTVLIKIVATNMAASDGLDLFFYVNSAALTDPEGYIARVTRTYADGTAKEMDVALTGYNATLTRFCYEAIAAKEMTDTVTGTLYYKDGTPASNSYTESVKSYAMRTLAAQESGSKLIPALVDMLNYGAGAQGHFGYATDNLANADEAFSAYTGTTENVTLTDQLVKGNNIVATSVSAKNKLMMTFYFQNITQQMSAKISYTDHYGKEITYTIPGEKFYPYNSWYGVDVVGVPVANGRALITCEVYDGDTLIGSAADSVEGYSARTAEKGYAVAGVMQQLMRFVDSAAAYFQSIK